MLFVFERYAIAHRAFHCKCVCVYVQQFSQCLLFSAFPLRLRFSRSAQNITKTAVFVDRPNTTDGLSHRHTHTHTLPYMTRLCTHWFTQADRIAVAQHTAEETRLKRNDCVLVCLVRNWDTDDQPEPSYGLICEVNALMIRAYTNVCQFRPQRDNTYFDLKCCQRVILFIHSLHFTPLKFDSQIQFHFSLRILCDSLFLLDVVQTTKTTTTAATKTTAAVAAATATAATAKTMIFFFRNRFYSYLLCFVEFAVISVCDTNCQTISYSRLRIAMWLRAIFKSSNMWFKTKKSIKNPF